MSEKTEVTNLARDEPLPQGDVTYTGTKNVAERKNSEVVSGSLYDMKLAIKRRVVVTNLTDEAAHEKRTKTCCAWGCHGMMIGSS